MLDLATMTEAEFTTTLIAFNLAPGQIEQVAALIDEARVRGVIPDVEPLSPRSTASPRSIFWQG